MSKKFKIAVAGTGYVGLSIATLLSQAQSSNCCRCYTRKSKFYKSA